MPTTSVVGAIDQGRDVSLKMIAVVASILVWFGGVSPATASAATAAKGLSLGAAATADLPHTVYKTKQKKTRFLRVSVPLFRTAVIAVRVVQVTRHMSDGSKVASLSVTKIFKPACTKKGGKLKTDGTCTKGQPNTNKGSIRDYLNYVYVVVKNPRVSDPPRPSSAYAENVRMGYNLLRSAALVCSGPCDFSVTVSANVKRYPDSTKSWNGAFTRF